MLQKNRKCKLCAGVEFRLASRMFQVNVNGKYVNSLQSLLCSSIQKKINLLKLNKEAFSSILKCETENTTLFLRF
jgi:hypothetical protein